MSWIGRDSGELPEGLEEGIRRAFVAPPVAETEHRHLVSIAAAVEEPRWAPAPGHSPVSRRRTLARFAAAGVGAALAVPVALAGLAFAGVSLPDAADSAFETLGIDLPNQSDDDQATSSDSARDSDESDVNSDDNKDSKKQGGATAAGGEQGNGNGGGKQDGDGNGGAAANGPPENANGPPEHAADGSIGASPHSQQGGGPPDHATDGSTGPPSQAQGNANGQSTTPAPTSPGSSGGPPATGNPHGAPPAAGPKTSPGVAVPEALP